MHGNRGNNLRDKDKTTPKRPTRQAALKQRQFMKRNINYV